MVSLRKNSSSTPKFLFTEGERVLCYEPDQNKARVLYDSKILNIMPCDSSTRSGRKAEYSVHFQGWNSSWDRIVQEEYILKDTPSNRSLQRELAEKAASYLKGKKLKLNKIPTIIKEVISSLNDQDQNSKDYSNSEEQASNTDNVFSGEDSSNSNFYTTNSNNATNELELTNQSNLSMQINSSNNRTVIKSVNDANLLTIINNETNSTNQPIIDNQNQKLELCQQIITNLDEKLKKHLEKDQHFICEEQNLYNLPVNLESTVHRILNEYEQFSLRMLNSSKDARLITKSANQSINPNLNSKTDYQKDNQLSSSQLNYTVTPINNHTNARTSNRVNNHQLPNQANNQINQQTNQSNYTANNIESTNSNKSSNSSSSLNCLNNSAFKSTHSFTTQTLREFTNSLSIYFNTLIDKLYLFYCDREREQFLKLKQSENYIKPIYSFGFIHLLRLIILLPDFLSLCSISSQQFKQLTLILEHFCNYLVENQDKFQS